MITVGSGRDVHEHCGLENLHGMPFALGNDAGLARRQLDRIFRRGISDDSESSFDHAEDFVSVGMNFTAVRRILRHSHESNRHAFNSFRRTGSTLSRSDREVREDVKGVR